MLLYEFVSECFHNFNNSVMLQINVFCTYDIIVIKNYYPKEEQKMKQMTSITNSKIPLISAILLKLANEELYPTNNFQ